ncbi:MAG TPA: hypothetical protein VIJ48_11075, partial [Acidimicrobiia bacterium]
LRAEAKRGISTARRQEMVKEATELNDRMQDEINQRLGQLQGFLAELKGSARRYQDVATELGMDLAPRPTLN